MAVLDAQGVAGTGDDTLDELQVGPRWDRLVACRPAGSARAGSGVAALLSEALSPPRGIEDDDVVDLRIGALVGVEINIDLRIGRDRRFHGFAWDRVGLGVVVGPGQ